MQKHMSNVVGRVSPVTSPTLPGIQGRPSPEDQGSGDQNVRRAHLIARRGCESQNGGHFDLTTGLEGRRETGRGPRWSTCPPLKTETIFVAVEAERLEDAAPRPGAPATAARVPCRRRGPSVAASRHSERRHPLQVVLIEAGCPGPPERVPLRAALQAAVGVRVAALPVAASSHQPVSATLQLGREPFLLLFFLLHPLFGFVVLFLLPFAFFFAQLSLELFTDVLLVFTIIVIVVVVVVDFIIATSRAPSSHQPSRFIVLIALLLFIVQPETPAVQTAPIVIGRLIVLRL
uniref:Uncharacterized protein n=1 Tax=Anopheles atroparvus TaxID=41427 RepID=A0A182JL66_ANOAO